MIFKLRRTFSKMWDESQQKWQLAHLISGNPKLFTFLIQLRWLFAKTDFAFRFCGLWAPRTYFLRLLSSHLHRSHWSWSSTVLTGEFNCAQKSAQTQRFSTRAAAWMSLVHINAINAHHSDVLHRNYIYDCRPNSNFKEIIGIRLEFREVADMNIQNWVLLCKIKSLKYTHMDTLGRL